MKTVWAQKAVGHSFGTRKCIPPFSTAATFMASARNSAGYGPVSTCKAKSSRSNKRKLWSKAKEMPDPTFEIGPFVKDELITILITHQIVMR